MIEAYSLQADSKNYFILRPNVWPTVVELNINTVKAFRTLVRGETPFFIPVRAEIHLQISSPTRPQIDLKSQFEDTKLSLHYSLRSSPISLEIIQE